VKPIATAGPEQAARPKVTAPSHPVTHEAQRDQALTHRLPLLPAPPWLLEVTRQVSKALLQLLLDVSVKERDNVLVHDFIWGKSRSTVTRQKPCPTPTGVAHREQPMGALTATHTQEQVVRWQDKDNSVSNTYKPLFLRAQNAALC
jgi:hypothetical protein